MGDRSKTLINSFSAAFKRLLKAIETHGHPDLADKTHSHPDLASKEDLDAVVDHYIPGSKRQCAQYTINENFSFNRNLIDDPDIDPDLLPPFNFQMLCHFDGPNSSGYYYDEMAVVKSNYPFADTGFQTNGSLVTGGVDSSNQIFLKSGTQRLFYNVKNPNLNQYRNFSSWSEKFQWKPVMGTPSTTRYIFRVCCPRSGKFNGNNKGLTLYVSANTRKIALRLRLEDDTVVTGYVGNWHDGSSHNYTVGATYSVEIVCKNNAYFVYVNGVSKQLYSNAGRTAALGNTTDGWNIGKKVKILPYKGSPDIIKGFGGWGYGAGGYVDEYSFNNILKPDDYVPATITEPGDPSTNLDVPKVGVSRELAIDAVASPLTVSGSAGIKEIIINDKTYSQVGELPLNGRSYIYMLIKKAVNKFTYSYHYTTSRFKYLNASWINTGFAALWSSTKTTTDDDGDPVEYTGVNDLYGTSYVFNDTAVDTNESTIHNIIVYGKTNTNIPGGVDVNYLQTKVETDIVNGSIKYYGSISTDPSFLKNDRWTIRIVYQRDTGNSIGNGGVLFRTSDDDNKGTYGLAIVHDDLNTGSIHLRISTDGESWDGRFALSGGGETGTVTHNPLPTGSGYNTLRDTSKTWTVNALANKTVKITGGSGGGRVYIVDTNTSDTLTFKDTPGGVQPQNKVPWTNPSFGPKLGSTYSIETSDISPDNAPNFYSVLTASGVGDTNSGKYSVIVMDLSYTGLKYILRLGIAPHDGDIREITWQERFDFSVPEPIVFSDTTSSITIGGDPTGVTDSSKTMNGMKLFSFQMYPYVLAGIPKYDQSPFDPLITVDNMNDVIDKDIMFFDKNRMATNFLANANLDFDGPTFTTDPNTALVPVGYVDVDRFGIYNATSYSNNAYYESDVMAVTTQGMHRIDHNLGFNDLRVTIYYSEDINMVNKEIVTRTLANFSFEYDSGTITDTSGTTTRLVKESGTGNWVKNALTGLTAILTHSSVEYTRTIISNEATYLTASSAWAPTPDVNDTYVILLPSTEIHLKIKDITETNLVLEISNEYGASVDLGYLKVVVERTW